MAQNLDFKKLIPSYLRNEIINSLSDNLFNRFVSTDDSIFVSGNVGQVSDTDPEIAQSSLERRENALTPALYFSTGTEQSLFTFADIVNKMESIGIDVASMRTWIAEQNFNLAPPIDFDKFVNYTNYYWVGEISSIAAPVWNSNLSPEYYVIQRPKADDPTVKMPVRLATTRDIALWANDRQPETITLTFTSATTIAASTNLSAAADALIIKDASGNLIGTLANPLTTAFEAKTPIVVWAKNTSAIPSIETPNSVGGYYPLLEMTIENGRTAAFSAGDSIVIDVVYFTSQIQSAIVSPNPVGKGTVTGVNTVSEMMYIDGVQVNDGDRILVYQQSDTTKNGIYVVRKGSVWDRAPDASLNSHFTVGQSIEVLEGTTNAGKFFEVATKNTSSAETDPIDASLTFTESATGIRVNDWQRYNFWVHRDDVASITGSDVGVSLAVQAQRPIIEFLNTLQLNGAVDEDNNPSEIGTSYVQVKSRFNQIPQFDLFRYDGTHAGATSGIWFYKESQEFPIDSVLNRRAAFTSNSDFIFAQGLIDSNGRHLFFKNAGEIQSIWTGGPTMPHISDIAWTGDLADSAALTLSNIQEYADNQTWTIEFTSPLEANVSGTKSGNVGIISVGETIVLDDFDLTLASSASTFAAGQKFTFRVHNKIAPRYVKDVDGKSVQNYPFRAAGFSSGYEADQANVVQDGAWLSSARMYQNLNRENRNEIAFADFLNHARSILRAQSGFSGSSFGNNNSRLIDLDLGLGGRIREFDSNFPLLASMMVQDDVTPLTLIDFAEQQYFTALSSVDQYVSQNLVEYISNLFPIPTNISIDPQDPNILALRDQYEAFRAADYNLTSVFSDTTAGIKNWPLTLPMMGMLDKVEPTVVYDAELDQDVLRHHDGHYSALFPSDAGVNRNLAAIVVKRSDGTTTAGVISNTMPLTPYARQLWFVPETGELFVFAVEFDTTVAPVGTETGQYWFNRTTSAIRVWDNTTKSWNATAETVASRFTPIYPENVRNSLLLSIEQKLYENIHPYQHQTVDIKSADITQSTALELEYAKYATKYGVDPQATDYDEANPFSWNYSSVDFPVIGTNNARWSDIYRAYFATFGINDFYRPDLEPWKMQGFATKPAGWDATYLCDVIPTNDTATVRVISTVNQVTPLMGLRIIDGVQTVAGNKVLLANQDDPSQNGIYVVSSGGWIRSTDTIEFGLTVQVQAGDYAGTTWVVTTPNPITPAITDVTFEQARIYNSVLWDDIRAANPGMKLCIDTVRDVLIPPYVNPDLLASAEALTTDEVASRADPYLFGQNGPVEAVWTRSLEYLYGLARTAFRLSPMSFLNNVWGDTYIQTGNSLRTERNLQRSLDHKSFLLHGERLHLTAERNAQSLFDNLNLDVDTAFNGSIDFVVTHVADSNTVSFDGQNLGKSGTVFSVMVNGNPLLNAGSQVYVVEGVPFSMTVSDLVFDNVTIFDRGIPFNYGDIIRINVTANLVSSIIVDDNSSFNVGLLGCEGCVSPGAADGTQVIVSERVPATFTFIGSEVKTFLGLGQIFTNILRYAFVDTQMSRVIQAYRGWDVKLAHRLGAMVRPDSLRVLSQGDVVPDTGYDVILKKSSAVDSLWIAGLRIQLLEVGSSKISVDSRLVPSSDASDWTFRIESYSTANPIIEINELDSNGDFITFNVLDKTVTDTVWKRYTTKLGTQKITLPMQVVGLQNVINVIFGYVSQLEEKNFVTLESGSTDVDQETGRIIDWQLDIEKMIRNVYLGIDAGEAAGIIDPFMTKLTLKTPRGLLSRYTQSKFMDAFSSQSCFDVTGAVIPVEQLSVVRTDEKTTTYSKTPIFSAHLLLDEYEHAIMFKERYSDETDARKIFDQFLGQWKNSVFLEYYRQSTPNGKPRFDGYVLQGNNVSRNIVSSIDALQNAYDASNTFGDENISSHAMSLIGFNRKKYFDNIGINAQTQLDFWRGMISSKGTNLAINAFTNYKEFNKADVDEFWAYKVAEYGDFREKTLPEIKISPADCYRQYASFQFYDKNDPTYSALPLFNQIEAYDDTRWFSIDDLGTTLRFDSKAISETVTVTATGTSYVRLANIYHSGDDFGPTVTGPAGATIINANTIKVTQPGTYTVSGNTWLNPSKLSPVKLFDYDNRELELQIGLWHPAIGIHAYAPLEIVNMTIPSDPASYNYSTKNENNPNLMLLKPWADKEVGRVWWDTSKLAYVPYYDAAIFPNRESRSSRWGALAEWSTIDLYQWTESPVHPSEYDARAIAQEGDASIDQSVKLSGKVGFTKFYSAERSVFKRAIAWSRAGVGDANAHPSFGLSAEVKIWNANNILIADQGRLEDIQLTAGRRFGGWNALAQKPVGEVIIGANVGYVIGSTADISSQNFNPTLDGVDATIIQTAELTVVPLQNSSLFGTAIGAISITTYRSGTEYFVRMADNNGLFEDVLLRDLSSSKLSTDLGDTSSIRFEKFGLQINMKIKTFTENNVSAETLSRVLSNDDNDIFVREYVNYTPVVDLPSDLFSNTVIFGEEPVEYGWRAWDIPTQTELTADLAPPNNKWRPYLGDLLDTPEKVTADLIADMSANNTWTLPLGITISRYQTVWSPWTELRDKTYSIISNGTTNVTADIGETIDANRISVYVNGIQIAPSQLVIDGTKVTLVSLVPEGHTVFVLYRAYAPTESELSFDPTVKENFKMLTWYKKDYEYTKVETRDTSGNKTGAKYYFWVKDKTVPTVGKSMSMVQAKSMLQFGDKSYMIFERLVADDKSESGAAYDSCSISGLNYRITKNDTYKLRFMRDFTLRDDPEELKLKNTHTEWTLIREKQNTKIPRSLWTLLTNAVCGQDIAGNILPSSDRVSYDEKYGTRTRYGFEPGQILVDSDFALQTLVTTIVNTQLTIDVGTQTFTDFITMFNLTDASAQNPATKTALISQWFSNPETARKTMDAIYQTARPQQINELFFAVLNDALSSNYEFTDIFKTSFITVNSSTRITQQNQTEQVDEFY